MLAVAAEMPLFPFVDFGIGLPFTQLTGELMGRSPMVNGRRAGPPTEVLVNFVHAAIYRNARMRTIRSQNPSQIQAAGTKVTDLGGDWWHEIHATNPSKDDNIDQIRAGYTERVLAAAGRGWNVFEVPISDTTGGAVIYDLLLFYQHVQARWFFNDAVSFARQRFQTYCDPTRALQPQLWEDDDEWIRTTVLPGWSDVCARPVRPPPCRGGTWRRTW